jgi:hypothetical protein
MNQKYFPFNVKIGIQNPCGKIKANCFFLLLENETTFLSLGKRKVHQVTFMLNNVEKLSTFVLENEFVLGIFRETPEIHVECRNCVEL